MTDLSDELQKLLIEFLEYAETSVDDGSRTYHVWDDADDMERAFEEWVNDKVGFFISDQDWDELFRESQEKQKAEDEAFLLRRQG